MIQNKIASAYRVEYFPSLFVVDRKGILLVALAYPDGLEGLVVELLIEPQ